MEPLGALVKRYPVDNGRRGRSAVLLFVLGLVVTPLAVLIAIPAYENSVIGDDFVPSLALGCGIGLLLMGGWLGWQFMTRSGEAFELYEDGLVQVLGAKRRTVRWEDVASLEDTTPPNAIARLIARAIGGNLSVQVKPTKGRALVITSLVEDADQLIETVRRAVDDGTWPEPHPPA